jgi:hypothetical protein
MRLDKVDNHYKNFAAKEMRPRQICGQICILISMSDEDSIEDRLDDLDDLIRYLENEKERLKKCVENAAREWEFSEAKAFAKAHGLITRRLHALKNLKDPGFDERTHLYRRLAFLNDEIKTHTDVPSLVKLFKEQLKETNEALDKLENASYSPIDTQHVDDAIFQLVDGTVESFKLHLNKSEELVFDFTCRDKLLQIEFSYKKGVLFPGMKKRLRKIGFQKVDGSRRFIHCIDVSNFKDALKIKQRLAVVLFDVFGRSWFDNPAELEINYKIAPPAENDINDEN